MTVSAPHTPISLDDVFAAQKRIAATITKTPTIRNVALSRLTGADITLKLENIQAIGSFKERGAANRIALLTSEEKKRGVITVSAGNHAQGVARQASLIGLDATIVMPRFTPATKVGATRGWGANVVLAGENFDEACATAEEIRQKEGRIFIHPFNDPAVMAGQGTCALELIKDEPDLDAVIVPIGGGGLMAGFITVFKALSPKTKIYGVQVASYSPFGNYPGPLRSAKGGSTLAEGIAVVQPGDLCIPIIENQLEAVFVVDELQIESAITTLAEKARQVCEGAGAAPLAGLLANKALFEGKKVALPLSGGNINARILSHVILRSLLREGRILRLIFQIPDRPGLLADISKRIGDYGGNIIEVSHHRLFAAPSVQTAELVVMIEARDTDHARDIEAELSRHFNVTRE
ncbi:threonine ammonia-lyase [Aristophania vespae]|uniref:Threonine ammonia-lyase n=1 Tax=Aristophania vespae TaxID=2697033 RepID=A0A6P1NEB3_9PROT|nr:threonine ammonia-lyase [Aristophania vespae]QHI95859.1 threonine ammonia-lyase [Aristophania vespae]UMM63582.1 L-threonine ammonia-lyase [Aristophania vespae]